MREPTTTIGVVVRELFPHGTNPAVPKGDAREPDWEIAPLWPPDLFAVVATLAERSGFYAEPGIALSTSLVGRQSKRRRAEEAERLGEAWAKDPSVTPPAVVFTLWDRLCKAWDQPVASPPGLGRRWKAAAMHLLAIADEACAGIGFPPRVSDSLTIATFVYQEYYTAYAAARSGRASTLLPYLPHSLALAVPSDRACVMPKALTPEVGCTLRSSSHNLALLPGRGQVSAEWRMISWSNDLPQTRAGGAPDVVPFNLLVVPFPYVLNAGAFVCSRKPDGPDVDGYFTLEADWLPKGTDAERAKQVASFVSDLIDAAEQDGGSVNAVIFPETALPSDVAKRVSRMVAQKHHKLEMFIAGVMAPEPSRPRGGERPFKRNAAFVARFDNGRPVDQYQQSKHHRWRVDPSQIERYRLAHVLEAGRNWWEAIDLADRQMVFGLDARHAVIAALICEDLARYDPVLPVLASVGPNLVIALLMDGPQLRSRWPSRHASVLADDPGSAVLTITSLGMVRRSETPADVVARDCVALWTERGRSPRELDLDPGAHTLLLSLSAQSRRQKTLDIRRQRDSGGLIEYRLGGCRSVELPRANHHKWLFNSLSTDHIEDIAGNERQ